MPSKFLRTYIGTALVKAIVFAGSIVTIQVIGHVYGPKMVGVYSIAISAVLLFGLVYRTGLPILVLRNRVKFPDQDSNFQYNALLYYLIRQENRRITLLVLWASILLYIFTLGVEETIWLYIAATPLAFVSAWLQLRSAFLKANDRPVLSSLFDMGLVQLGLALVILVVGSIFAQAPPMLPFAIAGFTAMLIWVGICLRCPDNHPEFSRLSDRSDQQKILTNAIFTFLYRNGYPLILGAFVSAHHIGYFRIEERLAYSISFIVLLTETMMTKKLISAVNNFTGTVLLKIFYRYMILALVPTILASMCLAYLLSDPKVASALNISPDTEWFYSVYAAAPFFAYVQFNAVLLNLKGYYRTIAISMIVTFAVFLLASYFSYSQEGLGGIRQAYLLAAVVSAVWVFIVTAYTFSKDKDGVSN